MIQCQPNTGPNAHLYSTEIVEIADSNELLIPVKTVLSKPIML